MIKNYEQGTAHQTHDSSETSTNYHKQLESLPKSSEHRLAEELSLPALSLKEQQLSELKLPASPQEILERAQALAIQEMSKNERLSLAKELWIRMTAIIKRILAKVDAKSIDRWQKLAKLWEQIEDREVDLDTITNNPETLTNLVAFVEYTQHCLELFEESGFIDELTACHPDFGIKTEALARMALEQVYLFRERLDRFLEVAEWMLSINTPDDKYNLAYLKLTSALSNSVDNWKYKKSQLEPVKTASGPPILDNFVGRERDKQIISNCIELLFFPQAIAHCRKITFNQEQPPAEIDEEGRAWEVGGSYDFSTGEIVLFPISMTNAHQTVRILTHELLGHGLDELNPANFYSCKIKTVPPWIVIRFLQALDNFDPYRHPATSYVAKVVKDEVSSNIKSTEPSISSKKAWIEQFAEMMTIFRLNPVQFNLIFGEKTFKAFAMYATAVDGGSYLNLLKRFDLILNHPALIYQVDEKNA